MGCGARFEPCTDVWGLTQSFRERDIAAREGRPFNVMSLAPRASTNASRQRGHTITGEDRLQQSAGANLAKKVRSMGKKARTHTRGPSCQITHGILTTTQGLDATTLDQIEVFQQIRAPNIRREQPGQRDARFASPKEL